MIDPNKFAFYGDSVRWFVATVVNNVDPDRQGRVQIRIYGVHSPYENEIPTGSLPWAQTLLPTTEGGTSGIGRIPQLLPNALVFGIFLDGPASQLPLVLGHLNKNELPSPLQRSLSPISTTADGFVNSAAPYVGPNGIRVDPQVTAVANGTAAELQMASMKFFTDQFGKPEIAAGICGNIMQESTFNPSAQNSIGASGLCQWYQDRFTNLQNFAAMQNKPWQDFGVQLQFTMEELRGGPGAPTSSKIGVYNKLLVATSYEGGAWNDNNATWVWLKYFEIPGNEESEITTREKYARDAYRLFMGQ